MIAPADQLVGLLFSGRLRRVHADPHDCRTHEYRGDRVPDSTLAREATEFVQDVSTRLLFDHSRRFLWASLQGEKLGLDYERLAHDSGDPSVQATRGAAGPLGVEYEVLGLRFDELSAEHRGASRRR